MAHELKLNGIRFRLQCPQAIHYKGIRMDGGYRLDLMVDQKLIVELKNVDQIKGIHQAQLLTYMKLAQVHVG